MVSANIFLEETKNLNNCLAILQDFIRIETQTLKNIYIQFETAYQKVSEEFNNEDRKEAMVQASSILKQNSYHSREIYLKGLKTIQEAPYFARIDTKTSADTETFYLGKSGFNSQDNQTVITDWRAPIASLYYNYMFPTSEAEYIVTDRFDFQKFVQHRCNLLIRRTLEIENKKLLNVYDSNLNNLNSENAFVLAKIEQKSGGLLEDIIETIQTEQNQIIRHTPTKNILVQGVAGSGKTTVALHRISYLLYNYPNIKSEKTLLLASSKTLINYLKKSLPDLGIENIECTSLETLLLKVLSDNGIKIQTASQRELILDFPSFINKFDKYCKDVIAKYDSYLEDTLFNKKFRFYNVKNAKTKISNKTFIEKLNFLIGNLQDTITELRWDDSPQSTLEALQLKKIRESLQKTKKGINVLSIYKGLDTGAIHIPAVSLLADKLGVLTKKNYDLVVVDEAQDLDLLSLRCIKTLSSRNVFNFFGDLNQAIYTQNNIKSWKDFETVFEKDALEQFDLLKSYRSTKSIIDLGVQILTGAGISSYLPEPIARLGNKTVELDFTSLEDLNDSLVETIKDIRIQTAKSIGIICDDTRQLELISTKFEKHNLEHLAIDESFDKYAKTGTFLVPLKYVKGLEFDTVFIINSNYTASSDPKEQALRKFVAVTRAMKRLYIYNFMAVF